ncbi:hypothetical protein MHU86_20296 [Fragilaria crotonensis]|nr:hypothetical protein MHU86_20296 [Fragilaria crotonensis]
MFAFDPHTAGNEKFRSDLRQFGGLLLVLSMCATFYPMYSIAIYAGSPTASEGISLGLLIGSLFILAIGISGALVGYLQIVHDYSNVFMTTWMVVIVQTAWIPYLAEMSDIGMNAAKGYPIFGLYLDTDADVWFYGAMGILGVFSYGFCFLGSLALLCFSLYAYQVGKPGDRAKGYYSSRLCFYSFMVFVAGLAQLMLGAYTLANISKGPIEPPPSVAMFTITYPEISVTVGLIYMLNGLWGIFRAYSRPTDDYLPLSLAFQWLLTITLTILTQIVYLPGADMAAALPTRGCLMLGAHLMPAFLDYKARTTSEVVDADSYALNGKTENEKVALEENCAEYVDEEDSLKKDVEEQPPREAPVNADEEVTA